MAVVVNGSMPKPSSLMPAGLCRSAVPSTTRSRVPDPSVRTRAMAIVSLLSQLWATYLDGQGSDRGSRATGHREGGAAGRQQQRQGWGVEGSGEGE